VDLRDDGGCESYAEWGSLQRKFHFFVT
jgi:hypothetical protein